jgi:hypothetical protein
LALAFDAVPLSAAEIQSERSAPKCPVVDAESDPFCSAQIVADRTLKLDTFTQSLSRVRCEVRCN